MGMMEAPKPRFMYRNQVDLAASLSATSAAENYPALAMQDPMPSVRWKSASVDAQEISLAWTAPVAATCLILHNHNLTYRGSVALVVDGARQEYPAWEPIHPFGQTAFGQTPVGGFPAPAYMRGLSGGHTRVIYLDQPVFDNEMVIELDDPDNPDGFLAVGRLFLGSFMQSPRMFLWDHGLDWRDKSEVTELEGGQRLSVLRKRGRSLTVSFDYLPEAFALGAFSDFLALVGNSTPFFFDPFPLGPGQRRQRYAMYCERASDSSGLAMQSLFRGGTEMVLVEMM